MASGRQQGKRRAVIIGGSMAGLFAAAFLRQNGWQVDQLAVDLGRRTADERIARLIINLMDRLTKRGMANDQTMDFPLRHRHIADATGLTPVHVSKVLSEYRRNGLIKISNRSLTTLDPTEFRRVANMR